jgi:magnesium-transporting ATPase (P-type)
MRRRGTALYAAAPSFYTGARPDDDFDATRRQSVFHGNVHRHLLILSLVNWAIAVVSWTISAYLGIKSPTSIYVYAVLFVIGVFAVVVAIVAFLLADFGTEPQPAVAAAAAVEPVVDEGASPGA